MEEQPAPESSSRPAEFWREHVRLGTAMSWAVIAMIAAHVTLPPAHPHRAALWTTLTVAIVVTSVIGVLPWKRLIASGTHLRLLMAWSLSLVPMVVLLALLDGGAHSPMAHVIVLPLVFAAMAYPVRHTLVVGGAAVVGQVVIALATPPMEFGHLLVQVTVYALIVVMAARIATNHQRSLARSEDLATRLSELAHGDSLTGCLNHRGFYERLDAAVATAQREGRPVALVQVDLDHFKRVNDAFGHPVGDQVLAAVGRSLRTMCRPGDVVARMGGEEFIVLLPATGVSAARSVAERIRAAIGNLDGPVHVTASVGLSVLPEIATTQDALMESADRALYLAKRSGRDRVEVAEHGTSAPTARVDLATSAVTRLLDGDDPDGLVSVFQPIVALADGSIQGFEALSRITGSHVSPDRWLVAAEQEGRRLDLELAMLDTAVATFAAAPWAQGRPLFVNISPDLLAASPLWDRLDGLPSGIVLELSERLVLSDSSQLVSAVERWSAAGIDLAIDDLGAGYANLRAVLELEPRFVKLDRSLVRAIDQRDRHRALVGSLVGFAEEIGTTIVAEGAEREEELRVLGDLGVPLAQGYGLARPANPPPAVQWRPCAPAGRADQPEAETTGRRAVLPFFVPSDRAGGTATRLP